MKAIILDEEMRRLAQMSIQLVDRRLQKLSWDSTQVQSENLETIEKRFHQNILESETYLQQLKDDLAQGREPSSARSGGNGLALVRFVKDVPSIIGVDLRTHGPFLREDVAKLPHENADSLIRQGAVVEIRALTQDNG